MAMSKVVTLAMNKMLMMLVVPAADGRAREGMKTTVTIWRT
jgi:hypothetical protein